MQKMGCCNEFLSIFLLTEFLLLDLKLINDSVSKKISDDFEKFHFIVADHESKYLV